MARVERTLAGKLFHSTLTLILVCAACVTPLGRIPAMAAAEPGVITTVAGNGISGYTGDGGPATSAELDVSLVIHPTVNDFLVNYVVEGNLILGYAGVVLGYTLVTAFQKSKRESLAPADTTC